MSDPIKLSRGVRIESGKVRSERFDREFKPLSRYRMKPVQEACSQSEELDQQSKERLAELRKSGIAQRFHEALEARETLYYRSFPGMAWTGTNIVMWHALQDLCSDPGDRRIEQAPEVSEEVRVYARHYRWLRVRDVIRAEREA